MSKTATLIKTVEQEHLASVIKSGSLDVLATPQMIAWMEEASCQIPELEEGMTSVGIHMDVSHDMASPKGAEIRVVSTLIAQEGRKLCYEVEAFQGDKRIGHGTHERFIVQADKFLKKTYNQ